MRLVWVAAMACAIAVPSAVTKSIVAAELRLPVRETVNIPEPLSLLKAYVVVDNCTELALFCTVATELVCVPSTPFPPDEESVTVNVAELTPLALFKSGTEIVLLICPLLNVNVPEVEV